MRIWEICVEDRFFPCSNPLQSKLTLLPQLISISWAVVIKLASIVKTALPYLCITSHQFLWRSELLASRQVHALYVYWHGWDLWRYWFCLKLMLVMLHFWSDCLLRVPTRSLFPGKVLTFDHGSLGPGKVISFSNSSKRSWKSPYFLIKSRLMNRCLM